MIHRKPAVLLYMTALALVPAAARAEDARGVPPSADQCYCLKPTNDIFKPWAAFRYGIGPECAQPAEPSVWFSLADANSVLTNQCFCRQGGAIKRYNDALECKRLGDAHIGARKAEALKPDLDCEDIPTLAGMPQEDCFCINHTAAAKRPREAVRYNWTAQCLARRYDGRAPALPNCAEASLRLGRCFCKNASGDQRDARGRLPECARMLHNPLYLISQDKAGHNRMQVELPNCDDNKGAATAASPAGKAPSSETRKAAAGASSEAASSAHRPLHCRKAVEECLESGKTYGDCVAGAPICSPNAAIPCCPAGCAKLYLKAVDQGSSEGEAFRGLFAADSPCSL